MGIEQRHKPIHEHARLAAARASRHDQVAVVRMNCGVLFISIGHSNSPEALFLGFAQPNLFLGSGPVNPAQLAEFAEIGTMPACHLGRRAYENTVPSETDSVVQIAPRLLDLWIVGAYLAAQLVPPDVPERRPAHDL